jgi:hypothetical protein
MTTIEVVLGDITAQDVDAVVTAAKRVRLVAFDEPTRDLLQAALASRSVA